MMLKQQKATPVWDVYSFGQTFYVLAHQCFIPDKKPKTAFDIFLWRCAQKDVKPCIHDMSDVSDQLEKLSRHHKKHVSSLLLISIMVMTMLVSRYFMLSYEDKKQQLYLDLIQQKEFEKAIDTFPDQLEAYRAYLSYTNKKDALQQIEQWYMKEQLDLAPEIKQYLISQCMALKDRAAAQFAYRLFQDMEGEFNQSYRQVLYDILNNKDCKKGIQTLYKQVIQEKSTNSSVHKKMVADIYELNNDLDKTMWMQLIQLYEEVSMEEDMHRVQYAFVIWQIERSDQDVIDYIKMLGRTWQKDKDLLLLSSLYMDAFESCIPDEEKHAHLHMLQEAKALLKNIKEEETIRKSLQQTTSQLNYLMEKWRIYE